MIFIIEADNNISTFRSAKEAKAAMIPMANIDADPVFSFSDL